MSASAPRMKMLRQRERNGLAIVTVEIDLEPATQYLIDAELLQVAQAEDRRAIGVAIGRLLDLLLVCDASLPR